MAETTPKIRPTLANMEIGDTCSFPVQKMKSIRSQASELSVILDRRYKTRTNRTDRTIVVTRLA
ncbi:MAG: hypothetical protein HDS72_04580 [Bacteroidales bacterium]|nr:hypothetical protein [Bacteroidales bacterium]